MGEDAVDGATEPMVAEPAAGRRYRARRRVRLSDTTPGGRLRLDAAARYLQDIANDDAFDSGITNPAGWVVRRTTLEVHRPVVFRERVEVTTFCSGIGRSWAERRTNIVGEAGGRLEAAALWVQIEPSTGRPLALGADFDAVYGASTGGRKVRAKLAHPDPPANVVAAREMGGDPDRAPAAAPDGTSDAAPDRASDGAPNGASGGAGLRIAPFPLRRADLDVIGHVNNAVYWEIVEEFLLAGGRRPPGWPLVRAEVEHRRALEPTATVTVVADGTALWVFDEVGLAATARIAALG